MSGNIGYGGHERRGGSNGIKASIWHGPPVQLRARGARCLGIWAADQMGYVATAREDYADEIVRQRDPVGQVRIDLRRCGIAPGDRILRQLYDDFIREEA